MPDRLSAALCLHAYMHASTVVCMERGDVADDVNAVQDFVSQVRELCARLTANPFNTAAAEAMLDVLLDRAPTADLALQRVLEAIIAGPAPNGVAEILGLRGAPAPRTSATDGLTAVSLSA